MISKRKFFSLLPVAPLAFVALAKKEEIVPDYISIPMNGFVDLGDGFVGVDLGKDDQSTLIIHGIDANSNQMFSSASVRMLMEEMIEYQKKGSQVVLT